jgi:hypothetical protein
MVAFTRKVHSAAKMSIRKPGNQTKGIYRTLRTAVRSAPRNNSRRVKVMHNENETRRRKVAKRKAKDWKAVVDQINDEDIRENIGLYVNESGKIVSVEGEITVDLYNLLIEELENKLEFAEDKYDEKILNKAIKFVKRSRRAHMRTGENTAEMNELGNMFSRL